MFQLVGCFLTRHFTVALEVYYGIMTAAYGLMAFTRMHILIFSGARPKMMLYSFSARTKTGPLCPVNYFLPVVFPRSCNWTKNKKEWVLK
jgi:hypothetical protein